MNRIGFPAALFAALLLYIASAAAQVESGRAAALDYLGRGTAAFRAGDIVAATRDWSEAIRLCRLNAAPDLEAQALARRGEAYRIEGYFRDASSDLQAALAKAEQSKDQALVAASSGALGNLAFMSRRTAVRRAAAEAGARPRQPTARPGDSRREQQRPGQPLRFDRTSGRSRVRLRGGDNQRRSGA
jgi:tetratricopeptide (TPR) repeat protein